LAANAEAKREGIVVPMTLEDYCLKPTRKPTTESGLDANFYDDDFDLETEDDLPSDDDFDEDDDDEDEDEDEDSATASISKNNGGSSKCKNNGLGRRRPLQERTMPSPPTTAARARPHNAARPGSRHLFLPLLP